MTEFLFRDKCFPWRRLSKFKSEFRCSRKDIAQALHRCLMSIGSGGDGVVLL